MYRQSYYQYLLQYICAVYFHDLCIILKQMKHYYTDFAHWLKHHKIAFVNIERIENIFGFASINIRKQFIKTCTGVIIDQQTYGYIKSIRSFGVWICFTDKKKTRQNGK